MAEDRIYDRRVPGQSLDWWRKYLHPRTGAPGVRARLRRSQSMVEAATIREALELARRLGVWSNSDGVKQSDAERALGLARVLSHVKDPSGDRPMRAAGWRTFPGDKSESDAGGDRPVLSELRFRRLLGTPRGEEQVAAFSRLVDQLDGKVHLGSLAEDFWNWSSRTKERWAFDYYAASSAATEPFTTDGVDE